jgi:translation initiation factor IF-2
VHTGVGAISESDITLAIASEAVVIGFNVKGDPKAKRAADQGGIKILTFSVIYAVLDAMKEILSGLLTPETVEEHLGTAEVRAVFHIQRVGTVAGSFVTDGKVLRNAMARVYRGTEVLATGKITTLKRFKDDVREVASGYECGLSVDGYKDVQTGDRVEVYELKQVKRTID